ncbi:MAG: hypothetical protein ACRDJL_01185 [Actinomycetota bacterium]
MDSTPVDQAVELLEKANAGLEPELLSVDAARERLQAYARAQHLAACGVAALARKLDEASTLARVTGTSVGKAKETIATSKVLYDSAPLEDALKHGDISLDQATEIARAEGSAPGVATELLTVAREESFHLLRERARKAKLEAEQHRGLAQRQHIARSARSYRDELDQEHSRRGGRGVGVGRAAGIRRGRLRGRPIPHRIRPRRAARRAWPHLQGQPRPSVLELPSGQDQTGPSCGQAQTRRALTKVSRRQDPILTLPAAPCTIET